MSPHRERKLLKPTDGNEGNVKANFLQGCSQNKINLTVSGDTQCRRKKIYHNMLTRQRVKIFSYQFPTILYKHQFVFPVFTVKIKHYLTYITSLVTKYLLLKLHFLNNQYFKKCSIPGCYKCCLL